VIAVIAAGERWPDQSLDPALEDLVGAGAIIDGLRRHGLLATLQQSVSGRELQLRGYAEEVRWAAELNVSAAVPVLRDGGFVAQR
jgi:2-phosphosulfolactate phosphatase